MEPLYHTTCLYSFCGHTTISKRPIRNTSSYRDTSAVIASRNRETYHHLQPQPAASTIGHSTLVSPFPSPQEFEFARELHDSVPASPTSPINRCENRALTWRTTQAGESPNTPVDTHSSLSGSILEAYTLSPSPGLSPSSRPPSLPTSEIPPSHTYTQSKSHPLHTFTVPTLCAPCRHQREANLARFEARAIKESVDREGMGELSAGAVWSQRGQLGDGRKRKVLRGKKGVLMPLICVEEGRLRMDGLDGKSRSEIDTAVVEGVAGVTVGDDVKVDVPVVSRGIIAGKDTDIGSSAAPGTMPSPAWSWWNRKAHFKSINARPEFEVPGDGKTQIADRPAPNSTISSGDSTFKSSMVAVAPSAALGEVGAPTRWVGNGDGNSNGVVRDVVGRNAKGMERILAWGNTLSSVP